MTPDTVTITQIRFIADLLQQSHRDVRETLWDVQMGKITIAEAAECINAIIEQINEAAK